MSNYLDMYRARIYRTGEYEQKRVSNRLSQDFKHLLKISPDYIRATLDGEGYDCILNSGNSRVGQQSERKVIQYLLTELGTPFKEGSVFTTYQPLVDDSRTWLCLHEELHAYYGYKKFKTCEEMVSAVIGLYERDIIPSIEKGLCAAIYTQLSDVEDETNGILSYDRKVLKIKPEAFLPVSEKIREELNKIKNAGL